MLDSVVATAVILHQISLSEQYWVNTSAQKYLELAQKTFGGAPASEAQADLIRSLTENYSTFAREHAEALMGMAAEAQAQMSQQVADASKMVNPTGSR